MISRSFTSIKRIGGSAFAVCENLKDVYYTGNSFEDFLVISDDDNLLNDYKATTLTLSRRCKSEL